LKRGPKGAPKEYFREPTKTQQSNLNCAIICRILGIGALFVFAQMVTVGLIALSATGGALEATI